MRPPGQSSPPKRWAPAFCQGRRRSARPHGPHPSIVTIGRSGDALSTGRCVICTAPWSACIVACSSG
eukprot:11075041-Alexandrium_andersonii.AAC.1